MPIEYLSVEGIDKIDLKVLEKYKNLKTISLDMDEAEQFEEVINELQKNNKKVIFNDIYNNQGEEYDYSI